MTFRRFTQWRTEGFWPQRRLPKCRLQNKHKGLIYRKLVWCQVTWVRSIAGNALEHRVVCARSQCARSQLTTLKSRGISKLAMAARATRTLRADEACAWSRPLGSSALAGARSSNFVLFHTFNHSCNARTCNTIKH
jgi:hypothetical protein